VAVGVSEGTGDGVAVAVGVGVHVGVRVGVFVGVRVGVFVGVRVGVAVGVGCCWQSFSSSQASPTSVSVVLVGPVKTLLTKPV